MYRVLVVEDNDMLRRAFVRGLQYDGFFVDEAKGGEEAKVLIDVAEPFDLLFVDLALGDMSAYTLLKYDGFRGVPIIILTGTESGDVRRDWLPEGTIVVQKPVNLDELAQLVRTYAKKGD